MLAMKRAILRRYLLLRRRVSSLFNVSLYGYGKVVFWFSFLVTAILAIVVVLQPFNTGSIIQCLSNDVIFDQSLGLVLNFMSIIFVLVIFLIQNANQEYSPRLSMLIFRDNYFLAILGFILFFSVFNLTGLYLELGAPYDLVSFVLSIVAVLLIGVMILFTGYFLSISNIVEYVTNRILQKIEPRNIYTAWIPIIPMHDDEFTAELNKDAHLLISTGIKAIEKNQRDVVESTLNSVSEITNRYLEQTSGEITDDDFLNEIADQFEFLTRASLENYTRQKYLEDIVEAMGDLALSIIQHREMGGQNQMAGRLLKSIEEVFYRAYGLDLTAVGHICINKINEVSMAALNEADQGSYDFYNDRLDNIAEFCGETKQYYAAILLQRALNKYQWQFVKLVQLLLDRKMIMEDWKLKEFFQDLGDRFLEACRDRSHAQWQLLYAALYGVESFNLKLNALNLQDIDNPRIEHGLMDYLEEYLNFHHRILTTDLDTNHMWAYDAYPEYLYLLNREVGLRDEFRLNLVKKVNDDWLDILEKQFRRSLDERENLDLHLKESMTDYFAVLIYLNKDDEELLQEFTKEIVQLYENLPKDHDDVVLDRIPRTLYQQLKLYGCWLSQYKDLEEFAPELHEMLISDFEDVSNLGKALPASPLHKYGYPTKNTSRWEQPWFLSPSRVWGNSFQYEIASELNREGYYAQFHEQLKGIHGFRLAPRVVEALKRAIKTNRDDN